MRKTHRFGSPEALGKWLIEAREAKGLSQSEVGTRSGLLQPAVSRLEQGHMAPSLQTLAKVVEAMGYSLELRLAPTTKKEKG